MAKVTRSSSAKKHAKAKQAWKIANRPRTRKQAASLANEVIEISTDDDMEVTSGERATVEGAASSTGKAGGRGKRSKASRVVDPSVPINSNVEGGQGDDIAPPKSSGAKLADLWKRFGHGNRVEVPVRAGSSTKRVLKTQKDVATGPVDSAKSPEGDKEVCEGSNASDDEDHGVGPRRSKRRAVDDGDGRPAVAAVAETEPRHREANRTVMLREMDDESSHLLEQVLKGAMKKTGTSRAKQLDFFERMKDAIADFDGSKTGKNPFIDDEAMEVDDEGHMDDEEGVVVDANGYDANDGFVVPDDEDDDDQVDDGDVNANEDNDTNVNDDDEAESEDEDVPALSSLFDDDDDEDTVRDTHARLENNPKSVDDIMNPRDDLVLKVKQPLKAAKEILRLRKEVSLGNLKAKPTDPVKNTNLRQKLMKKAIGSKSRVLEALNEYAERELGLPAPGGSSGEQNELLPPANVVPKAKVKARSYTTPLGSEVPGSDDSTMTLAPEQAEELDDEAIDEEVAQDIVRARVAALKRKAEVKNKAANDSQGLPSTVTPTEQASASNKKKSLKTQSSAHPTLQQVVAGRSTGSRSLGDFATVEQPRPSATVVEGRHGWLYDTVRRGTIVLPAVNELDSVAVKGIMAPLYKDCQPLLKASLTPWLKAKGNGLVRFDAWVTQCPTMIAEQAFSAMGFVRLGSTINATHIDIRLLYAQQVAGGSTRSFIFIEDEVATFMSSVYVEHSQLSTVAATGLKIKSLRGILHEMDYQRLVSIVSMTFNEFDMNAQLARDALQFVTRPPSKKFGKGKQKAVSGMFNNDSTVADGEAEANSVGTANAYALETTCEVPVYDARACPSFDFTIDIADRDKLLPRYDGREVPEGSFAVVGYTVNSYLNQDGETTLSFNIMWVVVCGVPGKGNHKVAPPSRGPKTYTMADLE